MAVGQAFLCVVGPLIAFAAAVHVLVFALKWCNSRNWCFDNPRKDNMHNGFDRAERMSRYGKHTLHVRFIDVKLFSPIFNLTAFMGEMSPTKKTTAMFSDGAHSALYTVHCTLYHSISYHLQFIPS
jgi:hypothetical protein